jgi:hypothetical protein
LSCLAIAEQEANKARQAYLAAGGESLPRPGQATQASLATLVSRYRSMPKSAASRAKLAKYEAQLKKAKALSKAFHLICCTLWLG